MARKASRVGGQAFPGDSQSAPVAQLDRAPDYESGGQEFESLRARQFSFEINNSQGVLFARSPVQQIGRGYVANFVVSEKRPGAGSPPMIYAGER
jgi:hypothetical protein